MMIARLACPAAAVDPYHSATAQKGKDLWTVIIHQVMDSIIQSVGNRSIVVIMLPDDQTIPTSEKGFSEMTDYDALGRYTEASSKLSSLVYERNEVIMQLQKLTSVAIGMSISAGVVLVFNVVKAQELIGKISKLEEEINSTIFEINTNATKCGKSTIRTSVQ